MTQKKQQLWSGLTVAMMIATIGVTPSGHADSLRGVDDEADVNVAVSETFSEAETVNLSLPTMPESSSDEVTKVGEYQSQDEATAVEAAIANILPHDFNGRQAATVYVRNIPVLTFLNPNASQPHASSDALNLAPGLNSLRPPEAEVKIGETHGEAEDQATLVAPIEDTGVAGDVASEDPVWRATTIAARLNQLYRDNVDPSLITVRWDADREAYLIEVDGEVLVEVNDITILPDTTGNPAEDALQATNRIRRQMGNASPLAAVEGMPQPASSTSAPLGAIGLSFVGFASWYGPGFDGNYSASGEVFDQNALTAAHPSLPFGTRVQVTNLDNGLSVVVRINDRGPYAHDRIIDLSTGAARAVGLIQAGVAQVRLDVLGSTQVASEP